MNKKGYVSQSIDYFAAANGYSGFRSRFGSIFNSGDFEHVYVLKGGPGTGKSTLMKRLYAFGEEKGLATERIFCSSDAASLDGVILRSDGYAVALLDGTAPHERDAVIPGAIDEIINLGEGFRIDKLRAQRERILSLTKRKSEAYKNAYRHLGLAGAVFNDITGVFSNSINYSRAEILSNEICEQIPRSEYTPLPEIYLSSFAKDGYREIPLSLPKGKRRIGIFGDGFCEYILMRFIADGLSKKGAVIRLALSPYSDELIEKIFTENAVIEISRIDKGGYDATSVAEYKHCDITELMGMHAKALMLAQGEFRRASELHFELEGIYKDAVDFTHNDAIFDRIKSEFSRYFSIF